MVARQPPHLRGTADMCMHMHGALQDGLSNSRRRTTLFTLPQNKCFGELGGCFGRARRLLSAHASMTVMERQRGRGQRVAIAARRLSRSSCSSLPQSATRCTWTPLCSIPALGRRNDRLIANPQKPSPPPQEQSHHSHRKEFCKLSLARHWARDWRTTLALTQVLHHGSRQRLLRGRGGT